MIRLWLKTLAEVGEARFDAALTTVLETSAFRPTIAEIRKYAGAMSIEDEAKAKLKGVIVLQRHHGRKLTNRGTPPKDPPGPFDPVVMATLADMGMGSCHDGLEAVWAHPALDKVRNPDELDGLETFRVTMGEKIERKWVEFYVRRKAEGFKKVQDAA